MSKNFDLVQVAAEVMIFFVPFLFSLCFHEFAHGWVARLRGDRTAEIMGRLTMNPMAHADPIGTVILPIMAVITHIPLFGWAKPVPVDERNLKNPRTDMFWVALAGPMSNILLAIVGAFAYAIFMRYFAAQMDSEGSGLELARKLFGMFIMLNVFLAVFNMLPLHPLDGGKVLARFLPESMNRRLEEWQNYTSLLLLVLFVSGAMVLISGPAHSIANFFLNIANSVVWIL